VCLLRRLRCFFSSSVNSSETFFIGTLAAAALVSGMHKVYRHVGCEDRARHLTAIRECLTMFRERILIFLKESETPSRHFICIWVKTNNPVSEKKRESSYEDYKAFRKEFSTVATVAALIFGIACSSAQANPMVRASSNGVRECMI